MTATASQEKTGRKRQLQIEKETTSTKRARKTTDSRKKKQLKEVIPKEKKEPKFLKQTTYSVYHKSMHILYLTK